MGKRGRREGVYGMWDKTEIQQGKRIKECVVMTYE